MCTRLMVFKCPVCVVYRVWTTVPGPSSEDAGLHHHTWKSGSGPSSGPVTAACQSQSPTARPAQHPGHHYHHHHNHSCQDQHHHQTYTQHLQERHACRFDLTEDLLCSEWFLYSSCAFPHFQPSINTTNIDTLLVATDQTERIVEPPETVQEKIAFIFNNLSQSNMTQKVKRKTNGINYVYVSKMHFKLIFWLFCIFNQVEELKETVKDEFMPWVSQYLVMKRVSIEPNFHSLYSNFLDTLKNPELVKMVLNETYRNIKVKFEVQCW